MLCNHHLINYRTYILCVKGHSAGGVGKRVSRRWARLLRKPSAPPYNVTRDIGHAVMPAGSDERGNREPDTHFCRIKAPKALDSDQPSKYNAPGTATWPSGKARLCKSLTTGSNPVVASESTQNGCSFCLGRQEKSIRPLRVARERFLQLGARA